DELARLAVEQDPAAAEDEQIDLAELFGEPRPGELPDGDGPIDVVIRHGVLGVPAQDGDGERPPGAELADDGGQDRLVTGVHAAVGAADPDPLQGGRVCHPSGSSNSRTSRALVVVPSTLTSVDVRWRPLASWSWSWSWSLT